MQSTDGCDKEIQADTHQKRQAISRISPKERELVLLHNH
jgi:hypothetical protein